MNALRALFRFESRSGDDVSSVVLLRSAPLDRLEETVKTLLKRRPSEEVRQAVIERMAQAPLSDFDTLKAVYLAHFGD
jgi:hypothetical protein